jgi:hypothetical protein
MLPQKRLLFIYLNLFLSISFIYSQNAYQDALFLARVDETEIDNLLKLKSQLNLTETETAKLNEIKIFLKTPFKEDIKKDLVDTKLIESLQEEYEKYIQLSLDMSAASVEDSNGNINSSTTESEGLIQKLSGASWQTMVIDATATIIAEQFKEGITTQYINKFREKLGEVYEVRKLVPVTYEELNRVDPFQYDDLGTTLKAAFQKDLKNMPNNFRKLIKDSEEPIIYAKLKDESSFLYLDFSIELIDQIVMGVHPSEILNHLATKYYDHEKGQTNNIEEIYKITYLISILEQNLRNPQKEIEKQWSNVWINLDQLSELRYSKEQEYFLALIYHQDQKFFKDLFDVKGEKINKKPEEFLKNLKDYLRFLNLIEEKLAALKVIEPLGDINVRDYSIYLETFFSLVVEGADLFYCNNNDQDNVCKTIKDFDLYSSSAIRMYKSILEKNYQGLLSEITSMLSIFSSKIITDASIEKAIKENDNLSNDLIKIIEEQNFKIASLKEQVNSLILKGVKGDKKALINHLKIYMSNYKDLSPEGYIQISQAFDNIIDRVLLSMNRGKLFNILGTFSKYTTFMVDITAANSSSEVKEIIKKEIVSPNNYVTKRFSKVSLSISAHPGLFLGYEQLDLTQSEIDDPDITEEEWAPNFGFTAPVGLELAFGNRSKDLSEMGPISLKKNQNDYVAKTMKGSSWSFFISLLDLGAIVNYRLTENDETELPQEVTFKQVFSPGGYLNFGFRNSPIAIGAGFQYTPELRKIGSDLEKNAFRYSIRFSWDIPLVFAFRN